MGKKIKVIRLKLTRIQAVVYFPPEKLEII